jgi:hypothetical protein
MQPIYTERLQIREFTSGDPEPFVQFMSDFKSMAFQAFTPNAGVYR